jgi:hypothetical protein
MKKRKILLTGGCSFSECISTHIDTWPRHLEKNLPTYEHISTGMGSQGNGLISRRVIYQVTETLKHTAARDILVGIMWSSPNRHDYYTTTPPVVYKEDMWMENPTRFVPNGQGAWNIVSPQWRMPAAANYYVNFHDQIAQYIYTLEHILRTQWFLQSQGVKYFMSTYTREVLPPIVRTHNDTQHLYQLLDLDVFLPVTGEYEWCRDYSGLSFPVKGDNHPSTEQHQRFTKQVILPFLQQKDYV